MIVFNFAIIYYLLLYNIVWYTHIYIYNMHARICQIILWKANAPAPMAMVSPVPVVPCNPGQLGG